jgi:Ran GTPase-activating protein (RanGAP) involved in mRNA processing and transport
MICFNQSNLKEFNHQIKENKLKLNSNIFRIENLINQYPSNSNISLRDQKLTDNDISIVIKSAIINKQCRILDLGHNEIKSPGILQLAESLQNNTTLKVLSLHQNSLSEMSILYLVEKLSLNNSVLKWLDLESTNLTDTSAEYLSIMLIKNKSLTGLWLSSNQIGYHGIKMLTSALIHYNTTLKYLDLENNPSINDSSFDCLMDMIQQNRSLKKLHLNNCQLSMTNKTKFRDIANTKTNFRIFL